MKKKCTIRRKITTLLFSMVLVSLLLVGAVSAWSLYAMKNISVESNRKLGVTAAENAEQALKIMAGEQLLGTAVEKAANIEEKFEAITAYVRGIASLAESIYTNAEAYPNRQIALPKQDSRELAAQLLRSKKLENPTERQTAEMLKLGNLQDLLVQYNQNNDMVSSAYLATKSGWMLQADYIAYSKYTKGKNTWNVDKAPDFYEATDRQWYQQALSAKRGETIYSDVIEDVHEGGNCIVCTQPVYLKGEIVAVAGVGSYLDTVNEAVLDTAIGENGYAFLVNQKGQVMVSPKTEGETAVFANKTVDLQKSENTVFAELAKTMVEGGSGVEKLVIDGREVFLAYAPLESLGWSFVTVMDAAEVIAPAKASEQQILKLSGEVLDRQEKSIRRTALFFIMIIIVAAILITLAGTVFTGKLTDPIRRLTKEVAKMGDGRLNGEIEIHTGDEVEELGNAFCDMAIKLQSYIANLASVTAEKERIRTELQVAAKLQADMLPLGKSFLGKKEEIAIHAAMIPAKEVGGDLYDFFLLDEDHLALIVADVSGKGVPAALFMVVAITLLRSFITTEDTLEEVMEEVNEKLCRHNDNGMFVTAWVGLLTISTGKLCHVNAGHCMPAICHKGGQYTYLTEKGGFVLGGMEGMKYRQSELTLIPGDRIFQYSDGVTEAHDISKNLYGEERLLERLNKNRTADQEQTIEDVWQNLKDFQGDAGQFDDITMLSFVYHGDGYARNTGKADMFRMKEVKEWVEQQLKATDVPKNNISKFLVAVDELFSNICYYSEATQVTVGCLVQEQEVSLYFEDDGKYYNPLDKKDPDITENLECRKVGGLGIYLVKQIMDRMDYAYVDGKNRLTLNKK